MSRLDKGIAALDMDGTILKNRSIDVLTDEFNLVDKLRELELKFKNIGEYEKTKRIAAFFKGYEVKILENIFKKIPLSDGIERLILFLKERNFLIVLITNSYTFLAKNLAERLKIQLYFGNELEIKNGSLTGKIITPLGWSKKDNKYKSINKLLVVKKLLKEYNIPQHKLLAIGDSENDYCMLKFAGIAVSYNNNSQLLNSIHNIIISDNFHKILTILKEKIN